MPTTIITPNATSLPLIQPPGSAAAVTRYLQTGYLYTYAFAMIIGLLILLTWFVAR